MHRALAELHAVTAIGCLVTGTLFAAYITLCFVLCSVTSALYICFASLFLQSSLAILPAISMAPAEILSKNYAEILQFVAISLPPFLQDGGEPAVPLVAWCAAYNAALVAYEYYQRVQVTDRQKNRLLLDRLGERGMQ